MHLFSKLRVLVHTLASSFLSLFWSFVLLGLFMFGSALILCQMLQFYMTEDSLDLQVRLWIFRMYGTSTRALYTVFEITFSGCWPNYARTIVEDVHWSFVFFFVAYI